MRSSRIARVKSFSFTNLESNPISLSDSEGGEGTTNKGSESTATDDIVLSSLLSHKRRKLLARTATKDGDFKRPEDGKEMDVGDVIGRKRKIKEKANPDTKPVALAGKCPTLWNRLSPHPFNIAIRNLNDKQKAAVKKMGFGKLLYLDIEIIPSKLGFFAAGKSDTKTMEIVVGRNAIKVDLEEVHRLSGVPSTEKDLFSIPSTSKLTGVVATWRGIYKKDLLVPRDILTRITSTGDDGFLFQIDFLILFLSTMVECTMNGKCKVKILRQITNDLDFAGYDWNGYVVGRIKECKHLWKPNIPSWFFTGPIIVLTLLYVENFSCTGMVKNTTKIPLQFWTRCLTFVLQFWDGS